MIEIVPFSQHHLSGVVDIILPIQQSEFEIPITLEDQSDLLNTPGFYQKDKGNFPVALQNTELIGTIALVPRPINLTMFFGKDTYPII